MFALVLGVAPARRTRSRSESAPDKAAKSPIEGPTWRLTQFGEGNAPGDMS